MPLREGAWELKTLVHDEDILASLSSQGGQRSRGNVHYPSFEFA